MRRAPKIDANQRIITAALRQAGCTVATLYSSGHDHSAGLPDLLIGRAGINYLAEVKVPKEKLNTVQREWHSAWRGAVMIWYGIEDAIRWLERP